jgi:hypothetical protein
MRVNSREILLASASVLALSAGPAMAQLVSFGSGTISAPNTTSGVSIGLLASQINTSLSGSAVVNNGSGITTAPGASSAADATTSVTTNTIAATMAGNVAGPATGQLYTVDLAGMSSDGTGSAATTAYQLNTNPNVVAGVGVSDTGAPAGAAQTIGSTFSTQLTSSAAVTGNTIGSTAVGNQAANVAGGATPGAGIAGGSASVDVIGSLQQRTNTLNYNNYVSTDSSADFTTAGAQTMPSGGVASTGTLIYVDSLGTGAAASAYFTSNAAAPTTGTYGTVADPGGSVSGVIAATTLQRNTDIASTGGIRAITDGAAVSAQLQAGASSATLDNSLNTVTAAATGNTATTGIAITGGAPTINGGLAVLNEQVNATSGTGAAGISATTNGSSVTASLGATAGTSLASSSALMEGNRLTAAATGSTATNTLTVDGLVRLEAAGALTTPGNGTGSVSTGALLSQERTVYTETVTDPLNPTTLETGAYTTVAADSSGVAPYQAASAVADYLSVNIQRNSGTATAPLTVTGTVSGGGITLGTSTATAGTTATSSTVGLTGNSVTADATGARATTSIGNGTATLLGDGASLAALSLQEASSTSTRAEVSNSGIGVALAGATAGTTTLGGVLSGGTVSVGSNTVAATGVSNVASTSLSNIAASGGTLSTGATFGSGIRTDATGENVDVSYTAPLAAVSSQRLTSAVDATTNATDAVIASATVANTDVTLRLVQDAATGTPTAATGSTIGLTGNRTLATAGGNQATVGVSFAEGSGSLLPGGAVAGNSQILAPTVTGTGITASISDSSMQVSATGVGGLGAAGFVGGSVTASGNRIASQAIGNQGAGSITASSLLIAGGAGGSGATASLTNDTPSVFTNDTATASYLLANTQRAVPSTGTMAISSTVADGSVSVIGGGSAATVAVDGNVVSAVGAANVFSGALTGLSSTGAATQLAVSQQDVAGVSVTSGLTNAAAVFSIGNGSLSGIDSTTTAQAFASGSASVSDNTFRALSVMNESGLSVTGAGVADLGTTGGGRIATAALTGSAVTLSGIEAGAASQQALSLDNTGTTANAGAYGVSSTSGARIGVNGGLTSVGFENTTLDVTGNTVDARTLGNTATVSTTGSVFAGGVAAVNSQSVSQNGSNTLAGLSASNTGTTVGLGTDTLAPPVGTSAMTVANNTVSASTAANDAQLQVAALTSGSLGNGSLSSRASSDVALTTGGGSTAFLNSVDADYLTANVQTTSGLRASSTVGGTGTDAVSIRAAASAVTGTTAINGNRVTAETVGNRVGASTSLPALNAGYVQTASYQANTGGRFASDVVNATVEFAASSPSTLARSTASVANNTILASAQGNVFNGSMVLPTAGANYAQSAAQQVNNGTSIAASVRGATVNVAGAGGLASSTLSGNTVGASAMGNVLRATVGSR